MRGKELRLPGGKIHRTEFLGATVEYEQSVLSQGKSFWLVEPVNDRDDGSGGINPDDPPFSQFTDKECSIIRCDDLARL